MFKKVLGIEQLERKDLFAGVADGMETEEEPVRHHDIAGNTVAVEIARDHITVEAVEEAPHVSPEAVLIDPVVIDIEPGRISVEAAQPGDAFGDIAVDRARARAVYEEWSGMTRAPKGDLRRPLWIPRAVRPADEAYRLE